jgi:hypothetical protein
VLSTWVCARQMCMCLCFIARSVRWVGMVAAAAGAEEYTFRVSTLAMLGKHQVCRMLPLVASIGLWLYQRAQM